MLRRFFSCGLLLTISLATFGGDKPEAKRPPPPTNAGPEQMQTLAGTCLASDNDGKPSNQVVSIIKLTAGGGMVLETLNPGQSHEMVSIYTVDGRDMTMTHYCVVGNQPCTKSDRNSSANQIVVRFSAGGNLDPNKDKHRHY